MHYYILHDVMFKDRCAAGGRDRLKRVWKDGRDVKHVSAAVVSDVYEGVSRDVVVQRLWTVDAVVWSSTFWLR